MKIHTCTWRCRWVMWILAGLLAFLWAGVVLGQDLPPCHPMMGPGTECEMPELPPPGGIQTAMPVCGPDLLPGTVCVWAGAGRVVPIEVLAVSSANPADIAYRYAATLFLPTPQDAPALTLLHGVLLLQMNLQTTASCGTDYPHRYFESAFVPMIGENCDPTEAP